MSKTDNTPSTPANEHANTDTAVVVLDTPVRRGDTLITEITLRKPRTGELRGISLAELLQMQVSALRLVLPRITQPTLNTVDVDNLSPADTMQMAVEVSNFLLTKADRERAFQSA